LRVDHEDDPVGALQNQASAGLVVNLSWHGVDVETDLVAGNGTQLHGHEVEEQGPLFARLQ